jgi:hypothetical protein
MFRQTIYYPRWKQREWKEWVASKYGKDSDLYQNFTIKRSIAVYRNNAIKALGLESNGKP